MPAIWLILTVSASGIISAWADSTDKFAVIECLDSFNIQRGTIILTRESLSRGAIFLDVDRTEDHNQCVLMCCQTEGCSTTVYDTKTGHCYSFACGPEDGNLCVFDSEVNFISSTLQRHDRSTDDGRGHQHSHAQQLQHLRDSKVSSSETQLKSLSKNQEVPLKELLNSKDGDREKPLHVSAKKGVACGRHQFQCHSGECVAIYNVCDGVAQCADSSDEHEELACPSQAEYPYANNAIFNHRQPPLVGGANYPHYRMNQVPAAQINQQLGYGPGLVPVDPYAVQAWPQNNGVPIYPVNSVPAAMVPLTYRYPVADRENGMPPQTKSKKTPNAPSSDIEQKPVNTSEAELTTQATTSTKLNENKAVNGTHSANVSLNQVELTFDVEQIKAAEKLQLFQTKLAASLLCLGIFMFMTLLAALLCRLQCCRVRVKIKNLKQKLSHDSDYLINGLYT